MTEPLIRRDTEITLSVPSRIEHYSIRKRDWNDIKSAVHDMRVAPNWASGGAWACAGIFGSGLLTLLGFATASITIAWIWTVGWAAVAASGVAATLMFIFSQKLNSQTKTDGQKLQERMDAIAAECDLERQN